MCDNVDGWQTRYKSDWKYVSKSHFNFFGKVLFQFIGSESMSKWDFVFTNNGAREKGKESKADSYLLNYFMLLIELRCCSGAINFCREYLCRFYKAENAKISCWWNNSIPGFFPHSVKGRCLHLLTCAKCEEKDSNQDNLCMISHLCWKLGLMHNS